MRAARTRLELPRLLEIVAGYAASRPGKGALLALEPENDLAMLEERLDEVEELRALVRAGLPFRLEGMTDIEPLIAESGFGRAFTPEELAQVAFQLDRQWALGSRFRERADLPRLHARGERMLDLAELRATLASSVDHQGNILESASPGLRSIRAEIERKERALRHWMDERRDHPAMRGVLQGNVVSVRNGRFVFAVRADCRGRVPGVVHGESSSGATLFIEPAEAALMGNELEASRAKEARELARILVELTKRVRDARKELAAVREHLLAIDMGVARARFAEAFGAIRPAVRDVRGLRLSGARHPLLIWRERDPERGIYDLDRERIHARIVPLDLELGHGRHQMVITGPNTGGKTVVLKTVGLLVWMTYCAIPIPAAEGSEIPFCDSVLADIGDEQSLAQNLSTFSSHMQVVAEILRIATARTLVLMDEVGAGTDPLEGAALGEAILEALYERGALTLVTTHIGRLKEYAFRRRRCLNAAMEFDPERLAPTYRLLVGVPGRSNATTIARHLGVRPEVVDRAEEILRSESRVDPEALAGLERTRRDLERKQGEMERQRRTARDLEVRVQGERESLAALRIALEHEAEVAEDGRVGGLVQRVLEHLREIGEPGGERREPWLRLHALLDDALRSTPLAERRRARARSLRKGDAVFLPRFKSVCEVLKINKSKELLTVSVNGVPAEVSFLEISSILPPPGYRLEWYETG